LVDFPVPFSFVTPFFFVACLPVFRTCQFVPFLLVDVGVLYVLLALVMIPSSRPCLSLISFCLFHVADSGVGCFRIPRVLVFLTCVSCISLSLFGCDVPFAVLFLLPCIKGASFVDPAPSLSWLLLVVSSFTRLFFPRAPTPEGRFSCFFCECLFCRFFSETLFYGFCCHFFFFTTPGRLCLLGTLCPSVPPSFPSVPHFCPVPAGGVFLRGARGFFPFLPWLADPPAFRHNRSPLFASLPLCPPQPGPSAFFWN